MGTHALIGRDDALVAITSAWRESAPGVLVCGPPGIGRTSVALAAVELLRARGADVVTVRVTAQTGQVPLAALAPMLGTAPPAGSGRRPILEQVAAVVRERSAQSRLAIVVDDAHHLDPASVTALTDVVAGSGFVLATAPDHRLVNRLLTHPALRRVELDQLDVDSVAELLAAHGADVADAATWRERTGGNPTAVIRLLSLDRTRRPIVPGDVLDVTLSALDPTTRSVLDVIAVAEPVPVDIMTVLVPDAERDAVVGHLESTRMLVEQEDGSGGRQLRYLHESDAAAIIASLPPLRLRSVVRWAVHALDRLDAPRSETDLVKLVALSLDVGNPVAPDRLRAAAAAALGGRDARLARRLARAAASAPGATPVDLRRYADLAYEHGDGDALREGLALMDSYVAEHPGDGAMIAGAAVIAANEAFWRRGDPDAADAVLVRAAGSTDRGAELTAVRARFLAATGELDLALALAEPILRDPEPRARHQAAAAVSHALRRAGRPTDAVDAVDAVIGAGGPDDPLIVVSRQVLDSVRLLGLLAAGRWTDAADLADVTRAAAERADDRSAMAVAGLMQALVAVERGHVDGATRRATDAATTFAALAQPAGRSWALSVAALAHALAGRPIDARAALADVDAVRHPATEMIGDIATRARAWAMAATDPAGARQMLVDGLERATRAGDLVVPLTALVDLVALDGATPAAEWLSDASIPVGEPMWDLVGRAVRAADRDDVGELGDVVEHLARPDVGGIRWAVELAAVAARSAARRGDRRSANRWSERAAALHAQCPALAVTTLTVVRAESGTTPLSVRERDVATLAAGGLTSREIGERLGISVRTVEQHLASCFAKLNVNNRSELAVRFTP